MLRPEALTAAGPGKAHALPAGCVADTASTVPEDVCTDARGIDDATDVAISTNFGFANLARFDVHTDEVG